MSSAKPAEEVKDKAEPKPGDKIQSTLKFSGITVRCSDPKVKLIEEK